MRAPSGDGQHRHRTQTRFADGQTPTTDLTPAGPSRSTASSPDRHDPTALWRRLASASASASAAAWRATIRRGRAPDLQAAAELADLNIHQPAPRMTQPTMKTGRLSGVPERREAIEVTPRGSHRWRVTRRAPSLPTSAVHAPPNDVTVMST